MNISGNAEFNTTVTEVPNLDFNGVYKYISQTAILPTILTYFNIKINNDWQLSSPSLIGKLGPQRVMINTHENSLYWYSNGTGDARIYKDKELLATVPTRQRAYSFNEPLDKYRHIYTVMINGQSGSVTRKNFRINAATNWSDNKRALFLFNDHTYTFYDKITNKPDPGYPKALSDGVFSGCQVYMDKVEALINWDNARMFMFLNDGKYILYDLNKNRIENGYPKDISNNSWPGLEPYKNEIIGAVKMGETILYFFTRDGRFIVFDMTANKTETTYALSFNEKALPGLKPYSSKISATMDWSTDFFYIFLKENSYLKYDKINKKVLNAYPMPVNNTTWPGLIN